MFTGGLKECEAREVTIHDVCPATMYLILDFIYTGQIRVTELTVCRLLPAAAMFQVSVLSNKIKNYYFPVTDLLTP